MTEYDPILSFLDDSHVKPHTLTPVSSFKFFLLMKLKSYFFLLPTERNSSLFVFNPGEEDATLEQTQQGHTEVRFTGEDL